MNPSEFLDVLEHLLVRLRAGRAREVSTPTERRNIRSVVSAWFAQYRTPFIQVLGDERQIAAMDALMERLLNLASRQFARRTVIGAVRSASQYFSNSLLVPLSRAYWTKSPERAPAGHDDAAAARLRKLDADLADGYEQAVMDIEDPHRLSYRGPAAELREVLTGVLHALAPNAQVEATDWYKESRRSGARKESTPTRAERTKFILRGRAKGSAVTEAAESHMVSVEERLANVVNATYKRGSAAAHAGTEREELENLLPYMNALLRELLPPSGSGAAG